MVRNTLIAAYILMVLTLAAVARSESPTTADKIELSQKVLNREFQQVRPTAAAYLMISEDPLPGFHEERQQVKPAVFAVEEVNLNSL